MNWDCGVTASELETEIDQPVFFPIPLGEIKPRPDLSYLIAAPKGEERRLGVVEHDALL